MISIILPVKDEPYLETLIKKVEKTLDRRYEFEVLVQTEKGLTNAVLEGVKRARGEIVAVLDADGSHNPLYLPLMIELQKDEGLDLVICFKAMSKDDRSRRFLSFSYRVFSKILLGIRVKDPMSGYVLARKEVFNSVKPDYGYKFLLQILARNKGLRVGELPILFEKRKAGKSKAGLMVGLRTLWLIFNLGFSLKRK